MNDWFPTDRQPSRGSVQVHQILETPTIDPVWSVLTRDRYQGWLCSVDALQPVDGLIDPGPPLLSAELVDPRGVTTSVRFTNGVWSIWRMSDTLDPNGEDLAFEDRLLSHRGRPMRYRTWWRLVPEGDPAVTVWRPLLSRFLGWE